VNLRTVFPPMPTPFRGGEVDTGAIRSNVRQWIASGLGGIVALGTNGEAPLLDDEEAERVVEAVRTEVPADRALIAGAGHESTRATIAAARRLASAGADAVLVKTPHTYRLHVPAAGLVAHYTAVADASPVPVLLYNFPASTGVNLTADTVGTLAAHPNIVGMKETSTDGAQFADLSAAVPDDFTILCGAAPGVFAALCAGAKGAITAVSAVMPGPCL
jgi:4-hydroxy-2-oxoglutarate aldolase